MAKLTVIQRECLSAMADSLSGLNYFDATRLGGNGRTLSTLVDKGLANRTRYANGLRWEITSAGRLSLKEQNNG